MKILLTGASGYIGGNLLKELKKNHEVIAVSRSTKNKENEENVTWVAADLFAPEDNERVMEGVDLAVYLVHSMQPQAKLTQAKFEDMDALLADNFARAAANNGVKRIVYLSGIVPDDEKLSRHLASRLECEKILGSFGVPVTTLRAGLIVGPKGSSFPILQSLVERLPGLLLPSWVYNRTHPVALRDLIGGLLAVIEREDLGQQSIDIGGPREMNYRELFEETAEVLGKKLPMVDLPIIPVWLSKAWVALISGKPIEMVGPLLDSLVHDMVITPEHTVEGITNAPTPFKESVRLARVQEGGRARLVFRRVLDENRVIITIHEYEPALPWFIYTLTQARVHLVVMTVFGYETAALTQFYKLREKFGARKAQGRHVAA